MCMHAQLLFLTFIPVFVNCYKHAKHPSRNHCTIPAQIPNRCAAEAYSESFARESDCVCIYLFGWLLFCLPMCLLRASLFLSFCLSSSSCRYLARVVRIYSEQKYSVRIENKPRCSREKKKEKKHDAQYSKLSAFCELKLCIFYTCTICILIITIEQKWKNEESFRNKFHPVISSIVYSDCTVVVPTKR